jgi:RNA polymerase sigma factor (sigma-70 family)
MNIESDVMLADVALARGGDEAAWSRLVETCANTVCAIALAIVRNVEASEDVAQEVFFAAWMNLLKLRNPASFIPWLRQITRNQAHLWLREHTRERSDDDALAAAVDPRLSPAEAALVSEEQRLVAEVLAELPDETREVLVLYYRENSSARHVADLLGISEAAVKQRLSRARAKVREELLQRFGGTLLRTAPSAAFITAVVAATGAVAPTATAAAIVAVGKSAGAKVAGPLFGLAALVGSIAGGLGVIVGLRQLEPFLDEQEERELKGFRNTLLLTMAIFAPLIAWSIDFGRLSRIGAAFAFFAVLAYLYFVRLPPILSRRVAAGEQTMRAAMWSAASMFGTVGMMLIVIRWVRK